MWVILPLLITALSVYLFWKLTVKANFNIGKAAQEEGMTRPAALPRENALWYMELYARVFKTQNLNTIVSIMSDSVYHSVAAIIKGFNRIGIRKEITIDPYPPQGEAAIPVPIQIQDGKRQIATGGFRCQYREDYIDSTTNRILYTKEFNPCRLALNVVRSAARTGKEQVNCLGCGHPMDTGGELFICPDCGATYRGDSYDWMINMVMPELDSVGGVAKSTDITTTKVVAYASYVLMGLAVIMPILGFFASGRFLPKAIITIGCLTMVSAVVGFSVWVRTKTAVIRDLSAYDPLFSSAELSRRTDYLLRRLYSAYNFDITDLRAVCDRPMFEYLAANPNRSGNYVIDVLEFNLSDGRFAVQNGRQYIYSKGDVVLLALDPQRQVTKIVKKIKFTLYRNEQTLTQNLLNMSQYQCSGCGNSLDLTENGTCKFCGVEYDLADFDWKLAHVEMDAFV